LLLVISLACSVITPDIPDPGPTITDTPTLTPFPTDTPIPPETPSVTPPPLSQSVTITPERVEESGQAPNYTITAVTPLLAGAEDPRVEAFNTLSRDTVQSIVNEFTASLKYQPETPLTSGSFIDTNYEVLSPPGDILSLRYIVVGYGDGAAHPYHFTRTLTFDIERGEVVRLEDLFLPNTNPLQVISDYCKAELYQRDIAFDSFITGADPTEENYRNWNLTADGLYITFDEYQVAAYAAGAQTVLVPYSQLTSILDPSGPVSKITK